VTLWLALGPSSPSEADPDPKASANLAEVVAGPSEVAARAVSLDEIRLMVDVTSKELQAATDERDRADRDLTLAATATGDLRAQADVVAQETLKNAISGYQRSEVPEGLLAAEDLTASMRATTLGGAAVSADTESFDAYRSLRKDLEIEEAELSGREERVVLAQAQVDILTAELDVELSLLGELEERRLQNQAALVSAQASVRNQYRGRKQGFYLDVCPVNGPHSFIDSWGFARSGGRRHKGVDMLASPGTEIVAPVDGTVRHNSNSVGGRSFHLTSPDGNYFYGTHMSGFGASGEVEAGDVIGYVGDDGNAAGIPHLHFEIHPGGRGNQINPFTDTAAVCSGARMT
jgi:murein DD-endopeptidase MepM/ murein hydrolase activator NlpD